MKTYITQSGDWFDLVAFRVYGGKMGDEVYMSELLAANYDLRKTWRFPAGYVLNVPILPPREVQPLVPWTAIDSV